MTQSMTAFARGQAEMPDGRMTMEIRSVNNRYLDFAIRLADRARPLEPLLRERIAERVKRGRVEVFLRLDAQGEATERSRLNDQGLDHLAELQKRVRKAMPKSKRLSVREILDWPGVIEQEEPSEEALKVHFESLLTAVLDDFVVSREREGARLAELVEQRIDAARQLVEALADKQPEIREHVRERLNARIAELVENVDPDRLEQEIALLLNKSDVDEELDRLTIHFDEVKSVLSKNEPVGRKLDFLMQELHREANTLGSKAAHPDVTNTSMELKLLIEQMREQVQNIE